jgi:site-specific DNA-cytosine methylase
MPATGGTYMDCMPQFTHYSGFAGIGASVAAFKHLGGVCGGGFEWCPEAARVFERLNPEVRLQGDFRKLRVEDLPRCDIYDGGAPCQSYSVAGGKAGRDGRGAPMFEQFRYLQHHHQPVLVIFEQVPNFARFDEGELVVQFLDDVSESGYTPHQQVLEARHCDACQHRERLVAVAVRNDVRRRCGEFCFPTPVTGQRPAKTILAPLVKYEGERFASADFVRCDPVHYDSGLIKVGSVAPHTRGCTVWSEEGLLPTQRCVGQGPAGAAGLVLREGVVTEVALEESALAQQLYRKSGCWSTGSHKSKLAMRCR